jgi:hypothetical protein
LLGRFHISLRVQKCSAPVWVDILIASIFAIAWFIMGMWGSANSRAFGMVAFNVCGAREFLQAYLSMDLLLLIRVLRSVTIYLCFLVTTVRSIDRLGENNWGRHVHDFEEGVVQLAGCPETVYTLFEQWYQ